MDNTKLSKEEINKFRDIRIHKLLGLQDNGRRVAIACPFHHGKNPNLNIYFDNTFFCFKCGAKGKGSIDFCKLLGYSFVDSLVQLLNYI